jgi:hypothetical protein
MNIWVTAFAGLVGTIIGGAISYFSSVAQWRRQQSSERKRFLVGKLEDACKLVLQIQNLLAVAWSDLMLIVAGAPKQEESRERIPLEQLELLTTLYFPELQLNYARIEKSRDVFGAFCAQAITKRDLQTKEAWTTLASRATDAHGEIEAACEAYLSQASSVAARLLEVEADDLFARLARTARRLRR